MKQNKQYDKIISSHYSWTWLLLGGATVPASSSSCRSRRVLLRCATVIDSSVMLLVLLCCLCNITADSPLASCRKLSSSSSFLPLNLLLLPRWVYSSPLRFPSLLLSVAKITHHSEQSTEKNLYPCQFCIVNQIQNAQL